MKLTYSGIYKPWLCCDTEGSRPVMTTVFVDPEGWLVASNGYAMCAIPCSISEPPADFKGVCIPSKFLEHLSKVLIRYNDPVTLTVDGDKVSVVYIGGMSLSSTLYDAPNAFPKWRGILKTGQHSEHRYGYYSYTRQYMDAIEAALGGSMTFIVQPGGITDPLFILSGQDSAFGVVMPVYRPIETDFARIDAILAMRPASVTP